MVGGGCGLMILVGKDGGKCGGGDDERIINKVVGLMVEGWSSVVDVFGSGGISVVVVEGFGVGGGDDGRLDV
nr:hypothetical protein [Tanacetum cinerariifolium]